jgi:hypothetical protein
MIVTVTVTATFDDGRVLNFKIYLTVTVTVTVTAMDYLF